MYPSEEDVITFPYITFYVWKEIWFRTTSTFWWAPVNVQNPTFSERQQVWVGLQLHVTWKKRPRAVFKHFVTPMHFLKTQNTGSILNKFHILKICLDEIKKKSTEQAACTGLHGTPMYPTQVKTALDMCTDLYARENEVLQVQYIWILYAQCRFRNSVHFRGYIFFLEKGNQFIISIWILFPKKFHEYKINLVSVILINSCVTSHYFSIKGFFLFHANRF